MQQTFSIATGLLSAHRLYSYYAAILLKEEAAYCVALCLSLCLSVCPSVCPSVPFAEVVLLLFTLQPSYERTSKIEKKTSVFDHRPASTLRTCGIFCFVYICGPHTVGRSAAQACLPYVVRLCNAGIYYILGSCLKDCRLHIVKLVFL